MDSKEKKRLYMKEYYSRPEVKARYKKQWYENHDENLERLREYHSLNENKEKERQRYLRKKQDPNWTNKQKEIYLKKKNDKDFKIKQKNKYLKTTYGITLDEYNEKSRQQDNKCAICNNVETSTHQSGTIRELAVDHCHKTGQVRDLLCGKCNLGIGAFDDNPTLVENVIKYLNKWSKNEQNKETK